MPRIPAPTATEHDWLAVARAVGVVTDNILTSIHPLLLPPLAAPQPLDAEEDARLDALLLELGSDVYLDGEVA